MENEPVFIDGSNFSGLAVVDEEPQTWARSKVLGTAELLECIISHLPCKDAISAQHVCTAWRDCFLHSPRLVIGCFLRPSAAPLDITGVFIDNGTYDPCVAIELLKKRQDPASEYLSVARTDAQDLTPAIAYSALPQGGAHILNPLSCEILRFCKPSYRNAYYQMAQRMNKLYPNKAWTRMSITQPPITQVDVVTPEVMRLAGRPNHRTVQLRRRGRKRCPINNWSGVSIGDLVTWVLQIENSDYPVHKRFPKYAGILDSPDDEDLGAGYSYEVSLDPA